MDKIKNKYEVILGFVTLIISLSAFKDELAKVDLVLGYATITLADYFLWIVYGLSVCLYFYIIENIARDTKIGSWKIFDYVLRIAYFLFVLVLLTPLLLILNILSYKLYVLFTNNFKETSAIFQVILQVLTMTIATVFSQLISSRLWKEKKRKNKEEIEEREIKELDNANKLFQDGYYSHSVLESFKVLETHLYKKLIDQDIRVSRYKLNDIIQIALKYGVITANDLPAISDLRGMRNVAAHSDADYTKQQAEFALEFVKQLLKRNNNKDPNIVSE